MPSPYREAEAMVALTSASPEVIGVALRVIFGQGLLRFMTFRSR